MSEKAEIKDKDQQQLPPELLEEIESALKKCYTCGKCTSGCPFASEMDFPPSVILKWLALGKVKKALTSKTIWVCSSCQNCYSRCPFEINIPLIMDLLREYSYKNKISRRERAMQLFHETFLSNVKRFGRIHEASFIGQWKIVSGKWFSDLALGKKMFLKGKLPLFPNTVKNKEEVRKLFKPKTGK